MVADSAYPIKYNYIRLYEKAYRKVGAHTYVGAGLSLDMYSKINDVKHSDTTLTPHHVYSLKHDINPEKYSANGLLLAFQFNNREHHYGLWVSISISIQAHQK